MAFRSLTSAALLAGSLALPAAGMAASAAPETTDQDKPTQATVSSRISEVDACNQAQYQIPAESVLQSFRFRTKTDQDGPLFQCTVRWSNNSKATPPDRPILFPHTTPIPIIWSGWL
ncbi:MAG: hypothetical protein RLZZ423_931 [Cyanobacteriota bacterium]|jgi:hypothetical protein